MVVALEQEIYLGWNAHHHRRWDERPCRSLKFLGSVFWKPSFPHHLKTFLQSCKQLTGEAPRLASCDKSPSPVYSKGNGFVFELAKNWDLYSINLTLSMVPVHQIPKTCHTRYQFLIFWGYTVPFVPWLHRLHEKHADRSRSIDRLAAFQGLQANRFQQKCIPVWFERFFNILKSLDWTAIGLLPCKPSRIT